MNAHDDVRDLLGSESPIIRTVKPESFLSYNIFKEWHSEAIKVVEYMQLFEFRLEAVQWKVAPPYSVLLRLIAESGRHYFVTSAGPTMSAHKEKIDEAHLLGEYQQSEWSKLTAAILKSEYGD